MNNWLPIESGPKDGTPVLVANGRMIVEAWYSFRWSKWVQSESGGTNSIKPTHWMQKPQLPGDDLLIAAAPDLLASLIELEPYMHEGEKLQRARAAIRKAKVVL